MTKIYKFGVAFVSTILIAQIATAQDNFDTTGLTLIEENMRMGCGEVVSVYEDKEGRRYYNIISREPTINGKPLSEVTPSDLSNERVHFNADGTPLNNSVAGRNAASEGLIRYAERQMFNFHKTEGLALKAYSTWYRARLAERKANKLANDIIKKLLKTAIKTTLKYTVPGSEEVVSLIGDLAENVYDPAIDSAFAANPEDPSAALDSLASKFDDNSIADQISLNSMVTTTSNQQRRTIWDNAIRDYVVDSICFEVDEQDRILFGAPGTVGATVAGYLEQLGLPINIDEDAQSRIKRATVERLVRDTIKSEAYQQLLDDYSAWSVATNPFPDFLVASVRAQVNACMEDRTRKHTENILGVATHKIDESESCSKPAF